MKPKIITKLIFYHNFRKEENNIKTFLIQTIDDKVVHDFSFALIEAIRYHNWYENKKVYDYILQEDTKLPLDNDDQPYKEDLKQIIPIGSVEFVLKYLSDYYHINNIKPLNIPKQLIKPEYLKRWIVERVTDTNIINAGEESILVKDNTKIKGWTNIVETNRGYPPGEYLISEVIDIESEWRAFVFNNKLVGLQNYSGDFTMFPNVELIKKMINDFNYSSAYTLDVGINQKNGTFVIECHDFFSCGLYGFADYKMLPLMFINTWNKLIK